MKWWIDKNIPPRKLLTLVMAVSVLIISVRVYFTYKTGRSFSENRTQESRLEQLHATIVHLDEVLSMSARMATLTGDLKWETRYLNHVQELDDAIQEAKERVPELHGMSSLQATDAANQRLVALETDAFERVRAGRLEEARALLFSGEYEEQKAIYASGMADFSLLLRDTAKATKDKIHREAAFNGRMALVMLPFLLLMWMITFALLTRYHHRRDAEKLVMSARQEELDRLVHEKTRSLAQTNESLIQEIAEKRKAESELRRSDERTRRILDTVNAAFISMDSDGRIVDWNQEAEAIFGWSKAEVLRRRVADVIIPPPLRELHESGLKSFLETGCGAILNTRIEVRALHKRGHEFPVEMTITSLQWEGDYLFNAFLLDITDRKFAEDSLRASEMKFRTTLASIADGVIATNMDGNITFMNMAAERLTGWAHSDAAGKPLADVFHLRDARDRPLRDDLLDSAIHARGSGEPTEYDLVSRNGSRCPILNRAAPIRSARDEIIGSVVVFQDVSARKIHQEKEAQLQTQLLQSEKMASIGQLAAGVAHEINNPIAFVYSNLNSLSQYAVEILAMAESYSELSGLILTEKRADADRLARAIEERKRQADLPFILGDFPVLVRESLEGAGRVADIVRNLKEFSHADQGERVPTDLNACIEGALKIAWNEIKQKAEVVKSFGDIPLVPAYPQQLNQVFLNILVNAAQAIEGKGTVLIRTWRMDPDRIGLEFRDTGCGIPPEHLAKIFDPFFTTKPVGVGTGLGMHLAMKIVTAHQGSISVESRVGEGTAFLITLPTRDAPAATPAAGAAMAETSAA